MATKKKTTKKSSPVKKKVTKKKVAKKKTTPVKKKVTKKKITPVKKKVTKKKNTPVKKKVTKKKAVKKKTTPVKKKATKKVATKKSSIVKKKSIPKKVITQKPVVDNKSNTNIPPVINIKPANNTIPPDFEVFGQNPKALFSLKVYRGEGMALLAMNWIKDKPSDDFVGFGIEYQEPGGKEFFPVKNRLTFLDKDAKVNPEIGRAHV